MNAPILLSLALLSVPQNPGLGTSRVERLIDTFLKRGGEVGYQAVLLLSQRPAVARKVIDQRISAAANQELKARLRALRERVLTEGLKRVMLERSKTGLIFSGQWADLKGYDSQIGQLLLALAKESFEAPQVRQSALHAIGDLKLRELLPELRAFTADILQPDWLIEAAGLACAELGDKSWVQQRIKALNALVKEKSADTPTVYAALKQLATYHYRLAQYKEAIEDYKQCTAILEGRLKSVGKAEARVLREALRFHYYNAACSACKAEKNDLVIQFLRQAAGNAVSRDSLKELYDSIQQDGDLRGFRSDTRYAPFLESLKDRLATKPL